MVFCVIYENSRHDDDDDGGGDSDDGDLRTCWIMQQYVIESRGFEMRAFTNLMQSLLHQIISRSELQHP
jgi:hypothetical protein